MKTGDEEKEEEANAEVGDGDVEVWKVPDAEDSMTTAELFDDAEDVTPVYSTDLAASTPHSFD